jgi:hypothetical protein
MSDLSLGNADPLDDAQVVQDYQNEQAIARALEGMGIVDVIRESTYTMPDGKTVWFVLTSCVLKSEQQKLLTMQRKDKKREVVFATPFSPMGIAFRKKHGIVMPGEVQ